jgi:hypothetical protein
VNLLDAVSEQGTVPGNCNKCFVKNVDLCFSKEIFRFGSCFLDNYAAYSHGCRSQWPRGLRHEPSSPARTQIVVPNLTEGIDVGVCVYSVFMLFYM